MSFSESQKNAWNALEIGPLWQDRTIRSPSEQLTAANIDLAATDITSIEGVASGLPRTWDQVASDVASCRRCGLCEGRTQTVFANTQPGPRVMLIGEAPGEQEDHSGLPFVGPAGQLLTQMLRAIGLDRERDVLIVNAVKCRPPENRNPSAQEMAACQPWLLEQIAIAKPQVIFLLGKFAVNAVLGKDEPITQLRGLVHQTAQGVPAIATYHPAYLLRRLPEKAKAWEDLLLLKTLLDDLA